MKNGLPYYRAFPRDFLEGTIGMPLDLKGCYRLVLDLIYMQGGDLPDDPRYISGLLGCSVRRWNGLRATLVDAGKIQVIGGSLTNYRARKELETTAKFQDTQRQNASGSRKNNNLEKPPLHQSSSSSKSEPTVDEDDDARGEIFPASTEREELLVAMGFDASGMTANGRMIGNRADMAERDRWRDELGLSHADQMEIIRDVVAKMGSRRPASFKYFTKAMSEDAGRRDAPPLTPDIPDQQTTGGQTHGKSAKTPFRNILAAAARGSTDESWRKM